MPLTSKLKQGWSDAPTVKPAETPVQTDTTPAVKPVETPKTPAVTTQPAPATQDNSASGYLHWLATGSPMANWQRAFEDRFTRGGLDYLFGSLPSPAKTQSGLSTQDFLAQERAKTEAAKAALGPVGRVTADVAGYGMSAPALNAVGVGNPIAQGAISGALSGVGHGGGVKDIATQSAEEAAAGALSIPVSKYVINPLVKAARNTFGSGPPSSVVYPYIKPGQTPEGGQPAQAPMLGGLPGFRDPNYPANMSAQDLGRMARELEAMPPATGEDAESRNALLEIMKQRVNDVAARGAPVGGTPGSGQAAANEAYWAAGGPPNAPSGADLLSPVERNAAKAIGAGIGGWVGHQSQIPGGSGMGAVYGADVGPKAWAWVRGGGTPTSDYPAFSLRPPTAQQAAANLLVGGSPDYTQWLQQQLATGGQ